ncbi:MAG: hypothetical protein GEV10_18455 [Streptosporangiales bacterium]|nr:hypothetical protein [Streptosporangiales bacterium]
MSKTTSRRLRAAFRGLVITAASAAAITASLLVASSASAGADAGTGTEQSIVAGVAKPKPPTIGGWGWEIR